VRFPGQVAPQEIPAWLDSCDVGILPLRRDVFLEFAFPNKLPEFVVAGKAVLMSRLNAVRYYFSEEALAYCEPENAADFAVGMTRLYSDPDLRQRLVATAQMEYRPLRWEVMQARYTELVDLAVGRTSASVPLPQPVSDRSRRACVN